MSRAVKILDIYQNYISPLTGSNCRFYPTCSEYAKWLFENDNPFVATIKTIARILRCNQFFEGGIDYPKIEFKPKNIVYGKKIEIKYFMIPYKKDRYYLIKSYK